MTTRLDLWYEDPGNVSELRKRLDDPLMREVIGLMRLCVPRGMPKIGEPISGEQAAVEIGRINGWLSCVDFMVGLCNHKQDRVRVEEDYGADEILDREYGKQQPPTQ